MVWDLKSILKRTLLPCPSIGPKWFWTVQIVLDGFKLFWVGTNHFGQVQIRLFWSDFYNLVLSKMIWTRPETNWTRPKWLVLNQNFVDGPKSFWTHRRSRHKSFQSLYGKKHTLSAPLCLFLGCILELFLKSLISAIRTAVRLQPHFVTAFSL